MFLDTFPFQKGLESGKNDYVQGILSFLLFLYTFCIQKCLETEKQSIPLKKKYIQGILSFLLFLGFSEIKSVEKQKNHKTPWK